MTDPELIGDYPETSEVFLESGSVESFLEPRNVDFRNVRGMTAQLERNGRNFNPFNPALMGFFGNTQTLIGPNFLEQMGLPFTSSFLTLCIPETIHSSNNDALGVQSLISLYSENDQKDPFYAQIALLNIRELLASLKMFALGNPNCLSFASISQVSQRNCIAIWGEKQYSIFIDAATAYSHSVAILFPTIFDHIRMYSRLSDNIQTEILYDISGIPIAYVIRLSRTLIRQSVAYKNSNIIYPEGILHIPLPDGLGIQIGVNTKPNKGMGGLLNDRYIKELFLATRGARVTIESILPKMFRGELDFLVPYLLVIKEGLLRIFEHDIKSPLTSIMGWSGLMEVGANLNMSIKKLGAQMHRHAKILSLMLNTILEIQQGLVELRLSHIPDLVESALIMNTSSLDQLQDKGIGLKVNVKTKNLRRDLIVIKEIQPDIKVPDVQVYEYHGLIVAYLHNVIGNACKVRIEDSDKNKDLFKIEILLEGITSYNHEPFLRITVKDTGPGFSPDVLKAIHDPKVSVVESKLKGSGILLKQLLLLGRFIAPQVPNPVVIGNNKTKGGFVSMCFPLVDNSLLQKVVIPKLPRMKRKEP